MSIIRTADAFNQFLAANGMDAQGTRVIVEFDDFGKAHCALAAVRREFSVQMNWNAPGPPTMQEIKVLAIPFRFVAKVE